jgi:hypothetical protein
MKDEEQKYSAEKITQTQNPNIPKSHYHTIEIILKGYNKRYEYKIFFFCWDTMTVGLYFFFSPAIAPFLFSLLFWLLQNQEENSWRLYTHYNPLFSLVFVP